MTELHAENRAERRRAQRLDRVLDAAGELVASEGIDALTLGRLARELDLVPAALYRYFASKDALIAELQRRTVLALHQRFVESVLEREFASESAAEEALARVLEAGRFYLGLPESEPKAYRLLTHMLGDPRPLVRDDEALHTAPALLAFLQDVSELIQRAEDQAALAPGLAVQRALVLWGSLQGVCQLGKLARFDAKRFDTARLGEMTLSALLSGWGANPELLQHCQERGLPRKKNRKNR